MTGFSDDWLALREPADHAARNGGLLTRVVGLYGSLDNVRIVDLACGSGSNLRGLAPHLGARQHWRLVDHDPAVLAAARARLASWADRVEGAETAVFWKGWRRIEVTFQQADLALEPESVLSGVDLVTTAAFFDLVSAEWIARVVGALSARRLPLYAILTYSGTEVWTPPHEMDAAMLDAFHQHQMGDKGFGPAVGPQGAKKLTEALAKVGYRVETGQSPWKLGSGQAALVRTLAEGSAAAVAETGRVPVRDIGVWLDARRSGAACEIGHTDVLAVMG